MINDLEGGNDNGGNVETPPAPPADPVVPPDVAELVDKPVKSSPPAEPPAPPARGGNAAPPTKRAPAVDTATPWWWWIALGLVIVGTVVIVADAVRNREATD